MSRRGLFAVALALLLPTPRGSAYEIATSKAGYFHWEESSVPYRIHVNGSDDLTDGSDIAAVHAAMDAWNGISCAGLRFDYDGLTTDTRVGYEDSPAENQNLIVWREDPAVWIAAGHDRNYYAVTTLSVRRDDARIVDADIEVNGAFNTYTTSDELPIVDVQNTLTHEVGHMAGLDHSAQLSATMYEKAGAGELSKRSLEADDRAGLCFLYPVGDVPPWHGQGSGGGEDCSYGGRGSGGGLWLMVLVLGLLWVARGGLLGRVVGAGVRGGLVRSGPVRMEERVKRGRVVGGWEWDRGTPHPLAPSPWRGCRFCSTYSLYSLPVVPAKEGVGFPVRARCTPSPSSRRRPGSRLIPAGRLGPGLRRDDVLCNYSSFRALPRRTPTPSGWRGGILRNGFGCWSSVGAWV